MYTFPCLIVISAFSFLYLTRPRRAHIIADEILDELKLIKD